MILGLDAYTTEWLDLLGRWLHVIAAIAWVGSSFYFIALDNHLEPPADEADRAEGVAGIAWEIHGGGFYRVHKYRVAPPRLPERLLWFKWEAYTTWLSGFFLMVVLYYFHAGSYLVDPSVADLSTGAAIAISVGLLAVGWFVYDALCRVLGARDRAIGAAV
ncbi:MAG TPA: urate hydroxylase PuuD, partial [Gaiellaceae bacterium]|nr:urate hydroxylase PuuD [Gaiellaceae bacterium]